MRRDQLETIFIEVSNREKREIRPHRLEASSLSVGPWREERGNDSHWLWWWVTWWHNRMTRIFQTKHPRTLNGFIRQKGEPISLVKPQTLEVLSNDCIPKGVACRDESIENYRPTVRVTDTHIFFYVSPSRHTFHLKEAIIRQWH